MRNLKLLKLFITLATLFAGVCAAYSTPSCSTTFSGTTFQPKTGITDTYYDVDDVKFTDPSSESILPTYEFSSSGVTSRSGIYAASKNGLQFHFKKGDRHTMFSYAMSDLVLNKTYKIKIVLNISRCAGCTPTDHAWETCLEYKNSIKDSYTQQRWSHSQTGSYNFDYTIEEEFVPTSAKVTYSIGSNWSSDCSILTVKSIEVIGCTDQKIVSENGSKVCAGEPNVLIAKGLSGSTYKWEKSEDAKTTWTVMSGTESTITDVANGETYYRVTAGGTTLESDKITTMVCCSVAGKREAQLTVDFSSSSLTATNRVDFNSLDDTQSQNIRSTYTYQASGNLKEDNYAITHEAANGGWDGWKDSGIIDHTHIAQGRAVKTSDGILIVNCGKDDKQMFQYTIATGNLCSNTIYDFSAYIANIDSNTDASHEPVNAGFQVYGLPGNTLLVDTETGDLPFTGQWVEKAESFNSDKYKQFKLIIKNNHKQTGSQSEVIGNDIAIDDIEFATCSPDVKIYTDSKYKSQDTIVCDAGKDVDLRLEAHAVYDLSSFFKVPYYLFQTSSDKVNWTTVGGEAVTDEYVNVKVESTGLFTTGMYYRVWVGGDKDAVEESAKNGQPGTGCGKLTAVSDPVFIKYECQKCTTTDKPLVTDYAACPTTETSKPIKDLVTSAYEKLRIYELPEGGNDLGADATFNPSVVGVMTYYVTNQKADDTATGETFCESERVAINIEVKDAATVSPKDIKVCFDDSTPDSDLTFTTDNPAFEYTWKSVTGPTIDATGATYTLARSSAEGSINVTATDKTGKLCPSTATATYNIKEKQVFELNAPTTVCLSNPSATISAKFSAGAGAYKWYKNGAEVASGTITETDVPRAATYSDAAVSTTKETVTYKFAVADALCQAEGSVSVDVADKVDIPLVAKAPVKDNNICLGATFDVVATYTLGTGETLKWSANDAEIAGVTGIDLTDQSPTEKTTYKVELQGGTCEGGGSLTITVDTPANPDIEADKTLVCAGTTINITDKDTETAKSYTWMRKSSDGGTYSTFEGQTGKDITDYEPDQTYTYKKIAVNGACTTESNEVKVEVQPAIQFTIEPIDKKICKGQEVTIKMGDYPDGASLKWTEKATGTVISEEATAIVSPTETTVYTATVTKVCEASRDLTVNVLDDLDISISPDTTICEGTSTPLTVNGTGVMSVQWSPATGLSSTTEKTVKASPLVETTYKAVISNGACSEEAEVTVSVSSTPRFATVEEVEGESCASRGVKVSGKNGTPPYVYSTDGVKYGSETTLTGLKSGYTMLYIMDNYSCKSDTTINLSPYAIVPDKFFTPNADGNHELWKVKNLSCYEGYIVEIFDRYGRRIYIYKKGSFSGGSVVDDFPGWDGIYNGHQMPSDDYWYLITVEEIRKQYNGHFILKR